MISFVFHVFLKAKQLAEIYMTLTNMYDFDYSNEYYIGDMVMGVESASPCIVDPRVI